MEASLLNCCVAGDEIITVNGGVFGARWRAIGERLGLSVKEITVDWGSAASVEEVRSVVTTHSSAKAFCIQHSETSTTVLHPVEEILKEVKRLAPSILTIVDGISACATTPMPGNSKIIDIYIAGSQKAFMLPPGLAIMALSQQAWDTIEKTPKRSLYFDLPLEKKSLASGETSWTPVSTIIVGLNAAIELFQNEGLENIYRRHELLSRIARTGLESLGCAIVAPDAPCPSVTGFSLPASVNADSIRNDVRKHFGIRLAGGQGKFKGSIVRIGHMGYVDPFDVVNAIIAIGVTIGVHGVTVDTGAATSNCLQHIRA